MTLTDLTNSQMLVVEQIKKVDSKMFVLIPSFQKLAGHALYQNILDTIARHDTDILSDALKSKEPQFAYQG